MPEQLALNVALDDEATLENFYIGDNASVMQALTDLLSAQDHNVFLWGKSGCGCSHLLQAICHQAQQHRLSALYISLQDLSELSPALFENLEQYRLVAIDDIQSVIDYPEWQEALFHFYNRTQISGTSLLFAAKQPPRALNLSLADLMSRLCHSLVFQVNSLTDEQKVQAIILRAKNRGLMLSPGVGVFLLQHYQRNMTALFQLLEQLDMASIAAQRKITLPFVRQVLREQESRHA